ncbi:helix-turn-helix transcriptional regulator [Actinocrinis puniceicyclus]|uniref:Helix-turn-helix transcriptional regulator n=1 Tax=Actinocrinis puniceicyclus TaxID=977794 RepID=A0A8J7WNE5_9ACTN|nr:helix-turn-helix transcriptional regulator [Actinocrinis puniceicyclus]MBS2962629.1 helix-turn-helix transcriptional regulator [Actinocrinis puniceicyclus]
MAYDYERLARAIRDARSRLRLSQEALAERAGVYVSTVQNLEGRRTPKQWPTSAGAIEAALGKPEGWARAVAEGREPPADTQAAQGAVTGRGRRGLIDPDSPDPVIRELSTGPVAGGDEFREQLIRLYLDDVAEGERRMRERAAARALRLAAASLGPSAAEAEEQRKLDRLEEIEREIEAEDKAKNSDMTGGSRELA